MHTQITAIEEIKGVKQEVPMLFGTGNLTNDPPAVREIQAGGKDMKVLSSVKGHRFAIAFSNGKDKDASFYAVEAWGKTAELMAQLCFKGQEVEVAGRIKTDSYEYNGEQRTENILVVTRFQVKSYKKDGAAPAPAASTNSNPTEPAKQTVPDSEPIDVADDDLPF